MTRSGFTGKHSIAYLRNVDVQWDRVNVNNLPSFDIHPAEAERYGLRPGDLLVCEGGEVGRTAQWQGEMERCSFQKAIHRVRPLSVVEEPSDHKVRTAIQSYLLARGKREFQSERDLKRKQLVEFKFRLDQFETIIVQFRALGLIEHNARPRSVRDTQTYWRLTKHGDNLMTNLRALRRSPVPEVGGGMTPGDGTTSDVEANATAEA